MRYILSTLKGHVDLFFQSLGVCLIFAFSEVSLWVLAS